MTALVILSTGVWNRPAVGTVAAIDETGITIAKTPTTDIPETLRAAYVTELQRPATRLQVFIENKEGKEPRALDLETNVFENQSTDAVKQTAEFTAKFNAAEEVRETEEFKKNFADLAVGQAVHLKLDGAEMTRLALDTAYVGLGRWIILIGVCLFAFSTMANSPPLKAPLNLVRLVRYLADTPIKRDDGVTAFGVDYAEILDIISAFVETDTLKAKFVVEPIDKRAEQGLEREESEF